MADKFDDLDSILSNALDNISYEDIAGDSDLSETKKQAGSLIKRSYSLAEYSDRAKLAYAFLTSYGYHREVTLLNAEAEDMNAGMLTFTDEDVPSLQEFEKAFRESGGMVMGIACFDLEDRERYGIFMIPDEEPVLNVYCDVMDEDMDCLLAELDQKYYDLVEGIERDDMGRPI